MKGEQENGQLCNICYPLSLLLSFTFFYLLPFTFSSFYSHAFLANTSEKRASFEDDDEVGEEPSYDSTVQDGPTDAWAEEESLLSGSLSSESAAERQVAESLYNNGNVLQEVIVIVTVIVIVIVEMHVTTKTFLLYSKGHETPFVST